MSISRRSVLSIARSIGGAISATWSALGLTLALLIAITLVADWTRSALMFFRQTTANSRTHSDGYAGLDWAEEYFRELEVTSLGWRPWLYWRTVPTTEKYVNVDQDGVRATWHAPDAGAAPFRIWMFGGSLAWGYGSRDDFTIESYLAKQLSAAGYHVEIANFAERGYVSEQDLILLQDELIRRPPPDLVISLDGINDVDAAWWNAEPGVSIHEDNREREFNLTNNHCTACRAELYRAAIVGFLQWTVLGPAARDIRRLQSHPHPKRQTDATIKKAALTAQIYLSNLRWMAMAGRESHFDCLFYWQPSIFFKRHLTPSEQEEAKDAAGRKQFEAEVVSQMRTTSAGRVIDLTEIFADNAHPLYSDYAHVTEEGNEIIAHRMMTDVVAVIRARQGASARR